MPFSDVLSTAGISAGSWVPAGILVAGLVLDRVFREPPTALHPVVAMGRFLSIGRRLPDTPLLGFIGGAGAWCAGAALFVVPVVVAALRLPHWGNLLLGTFLLWGLFSFRMLLDEVDAVEKALAHSLDAGRARIGRLVSRPTAGLTEAEVRMAAIETLAENLSDSVVSPLFWYALLGLPGIALQRFANTADACWGYRGAWEWRGKWAARADDAINWIPARLTALAILGFRPSLLHALGREARSTESPNAGWPMGAMALVLGTRLEKPGCYALHAEGRTPGPADTRLALRVASRAGWLFALACVVALLLAGRRDPLSDDSRPCLAESAGAGRTADANLEEEPRFIRAEESSR